MTTTSWPLRLRGLRGEALGRDGRARYLGPRHGRFGRETGEAKKLEPSMHLGLNWYSLMTIQTRRRYLSTVSSTFVELRTTCKVMSSLRLLAQMRKARVH